MAGWYRKSGLLPQKGYYKTKQNKKTKMPVVRVAKVCQGVSLRSSAVCFHYTAVTSSVVCFHYAAVTSSVVCFHLTAVTSSVVCFHYIAITSSVVCFHYTAVTTCLICFHYTAVTSSVVCFHYTAVTSSVVCFHYTAVTSSVVCFHNQKLWFSATVIFQSTDTWHKIFRTFTDSNHWNGEHPLKHATAMKTARQPLEQYTQWLTLCRHGWTTRKEVKFKRRNHCRKTQKVKYSITWHQRTLTI